MVYAAFGHWLLLPDCRVSHDANAAHLALPWHRALRVDHRLLLFCGLERAGQLNCELCWRSRLYYRLLVRLRLLHCVLADWLDCLVSGWFRTAWLMRRTALGKRWDVYCSTIA